MLELCPIGHLGFLIAQAERRFLLDPLVPGSSEYSPAPQSGLDPAALGACTALILTSSSPLHLQRESLACTLDGKRLLVPAPLLAHLDPSVIQRAAGLVPLAAWEPYADGGCTVRAIPPESGRDWGVVVTAADAAVWFQGRATFAGATAQRVRDDVPATAAPIAVTSAFLDLPLQVLQGQSRGFPFTPYHQRLACLREAVQHGWQIAPVGGIRFAGRAAWLNAYAMPVTPQQMVTDIQSMCPHTRCVELPVGHWVTVTGTQVTEAQRPILPRVCDSWPSPFDPSLGMPAMLPAGRVLPALQRRLAEALHRVSQQPWWLPYATACQAWALRLELRVQGEEEEQIMTLHFDAGTPSVSPQPCALANMRARITASGLTALLEGRARAMELALRDHLRVAQMVHHVEGSRVRQPAWWGEALPETLRDGDEALLPCWTLLEQLSPPLRPGESCATPRKAH